MINIDSELIKQIIELSKKNGIEKLILFGSRAREDYRERSDIDLAAYGGDFDNFLFDVNEKTDTLLMFDIVNADGNISDELRKEIKKDGVVLYEKI